MAQGNRDTRPSFYKITMRFANTYDLRIPPDFKHHLPLDTDKATLRTGQLSESWEASELEEIAEATANKQIVEMAQGSRDTRPSFYKIIMRFANTYDLRIPPDFKHHLPLDTDKATLRTGQLSESWEVSVVRKNNGDVFLDRGWQDFVKHHSLGNLEFIVFKYNGDMSFDVEIFDKDGSARNTSPPTCFDFNSSRPFFIHTITKCNITPSVMIVPKKFQRKNLPLTTQTITLRDPNGIPWPVSTFLNVRAQSIRICGGWKAFVNANSIKLGDVCIFELVEPELMQVHIFPSSN